MPIRLRIATFNLENLDDDSDEPTLDQRIAVMRPQFLRIDADILCLQEVNAQEQNGGRELVALNKLLSGTKYEGYAHTVYTDPQNSDDERNLVIRSHYPIVESEEYRNSITPAPSYKKVTADPPMQRASKVRWERPILYAKLRLRDQVDLHVINLHLKSRIPTNIRGQKINRYKWRRADAWAEGFFVSSMKRVGQALETRQLIDQLFDADKKALIAVCGDFNADLDDVPVEAIRGDVENTGNGDLAERVMIPCERTVPEPSRFSLLHHGKGNMLDHLLVSRSLLAYYKGSEIHNEVLHDETIAFAMDIKYPESDHAPVVAEFEIPD